MTVPDLIRAASRELNEANDCTVIALAVGANMPYARAHELLATEAFRPNRGVAYQKHWLPLYAKHMKMERREDLERAGRTPITLARKFDSRKTYLALFRGHVEAWKQGEWIGWVDGRRNLTQRVWEIEPKSTIIRSQMALFQEAA